MKKIVILGSSVAAVKAAEEIRKMDAESEIALFPADGEFPGNPQNYDTFIVGENSLNQTLLRPKDFYEKNRIHVILGKTIARINLKRNKITLEDKNQIDFDILVITQPPAKFPDIKGANKTGLYNCRHFKDIQQINKSLAFIETIVIQTNSFNGVKMAVALAKREKDVTVVSSQPYFLSHLVSKEVSEKMTAALEQKGVHIFYNNTITELLGDGEAKAVRLTSGKVLASDMTIFEDLREDWRIFAESELNIDKQILVDEFFQSNLPQAFAVDTAAQGRAAGRGIDSVPANTSLEFWASQIAAKIGGQELNLQPLFSTAALELDNFNIIILGERGSETQEIRKIEGETFAYKKIFLADGVVTGAVLVNAAPEKEKMVRLITEKLSVKGYEDYILSDTGTPDEVVQNIKSGINPLKTAEPVLASAPAEAQETTHQAPS